MSTRNTAIRPAGHAVCHISAITACFSLTSTCNSQFDRPAQWILQAEQNMKWGTCPFTLTSNVQERVNAGKWSNSSGTCMHACSLSTCTLWEDSLTWISSKCAGYLLILRGDAD